MIYNLKAIRLSYNPILMVSFLVFSYVHPIVHGVIEESQELVKRKLKP